eukprot:CAMPEP_0178656678 /NCGR_PEP_ID=MMETSP0698-20121128/24948_1 /TAXON_ID=265572 /ORGANISM="Extubocellulus spinifer, Strain CCMP396" /LENGTH=144 /DNA_ID=CAMNT_0020298741 /DNA_START=185 /DNA_END=619 /DNA_ORIENTATION=+
MTIDLPTVERSNGDVIDAYNGPAGLSASCRPDIPYMGGVRYSSAFAMALCAAVIGLGAIVITFYAITAECPIPVLCGLSYAFATSSVLVGMTLALFRNWECDEGTCTVGAGAGMAIGAAFTWILCAVVSCIIPVRIPKNEESED